MLAMAPSCPAGRGTNHARTCDDPLRPIVTNLQRGRHRIALDLAARSAQAAGMRLRRPAPDHQADAAVASAPTSWDGVPTVSSPTPLVIRAARAAELAEAATTRRVA
jgi:hypothetical protein